MPTLLLALLTLNPPHKTNTNANTLTPARWHQQRRNAILDDHAAQVQPLLKPDRRTLPALIAVNAAQLGLAATAAHLPAAELVPLALSVGATLSLWQFALLHDVKHGTAALPAGVAPNAVLFAGSLPSVFGYFLYLRSGHLSHHKDFGAASVRDLFDSADAGFEDGDVMFVAHRQLVRGDDAARRPGFFGNRAVGGLGLSISRSFYALLWRDAVGWEPWNGAVYSMGMMLERAALVVNDKVVAVTGRNAFFPNKPRRFHDMCARHARVSAALQLALLATCGPGALLWLYLSEVGWQLPTHPASAMFVSNHPSLVAPDGSCQPTSSVYWGGRAYNWLCCWSNLHVEHHDFPDAPCWRLAELRACASAHYSESALSGCRDGWLGTLRRTFGGGRVFYACSQSRS